MLGRNWLRVLGGSRDYGACTTYHISGNRRTVTLRGGCIAIQIDIDEIALKAEQDDSRRPENDDWATTSSGSTHTSDYTWTERTDDCGSEGDLTSSEGSAYLTEYTEEDNISVPGSMTEEDIPAWHALKASDLTMKSIMKTTDETKRRKVQCR